MSSFNNQALKCATQRTINSIAKAGLKKNSQMQSYPHIIHV